MTSNNRGQNPILQKSDYTWRAQKIIIKMLEIKNMVKSMQNLNFIKNSCLHDPKITGVVETFFYNKSINKDQVIGDFLTNILDNLNMN